MELRGYLIDEIEKAVDDFLGQVLQHEVFRNEIDAIIAFLDEGLDFFLAIRDWDAGIG